MEDLSNSNCEACDKLTPKLDPLQANVMLGQLQKWYLYKGERGHFIHKRWEFKNFAEAFSLVSAISELAEKQGHHPNIEFGWGFVHVIVLTRSIGDLSKNDFILAAKIDSLPEAQ